MDVKEKNCDFDGQLLQSANVKDYFQTLVDSACVNQKVQVRVETNFYIVNLLTSFTYADMLSDSSGRRTLFEPLAHMYAQALEQQNSVGRYQSFRRLGDAALFVSGLFSESLNRKLVDMDYYIAMGGGAYGYLSETSTVRPGFSHIYQELSSKFVDFVDVLGEVSEQANLSRASDTLRLYETWLRTGSKRAATRLRKQGLEPNLSAGTLRKH